MAGCRQKGILPSGFGVLVAAALLGACDPIVRPIGDLEFLQDPANAPGAVDASGDAAPQDPHSSAFVREPPLVDEDGAMANGKQEANVSCGEDAGACLIAPDAGTSASVCVPTGVRDCSSNLDNDCDGQPDNIVDDVCLCVPGSIDTCDEHLGLDGRGQCRAGLRICLLNELTLTTTWGQCSGSVGPGEQDSCTIAGDDSDCDGTPNGGCSCINEQTQACGPATENGICRRGASTCVNGSFGECQGAVFPAPRDSCAVLGDDSNCNGILNEGCSCIDGQTQSCGPDTELGLCQRGARTCSNGVFGPCVGAVFPAPRNCGSQQDADCDGRPDNTIDNACTCSIGQTRSCGTHPDQDGVGQCRAGSQQCAPGPNNTSSSFAACTGSVGPAQSDSCTLEGNDANCNGIPNDSCAEPPPNFDCSAPGNPVGPPVVSITLPAGEAPAPTGGIIGNGAYTLGSVVFYGAGAGRVAREYLVLENGSFDRQRNATTEGTREVNEGRSIGTYTSMGTTLILQGTTCSSGIQYIETLEYSASSSSLQVFRGSGGNVFSVETYGR